MSHLSKIDLLHAASLEGENIQFTLSLPQTPLKTTQWAQRFATLFSFTIGEPDWGADRFQVRLVNDSTECLLCIEWLCEAIWVSPLGSNQDAASLLTYLQNATEKV